MKAADSAFVCQFDTEQKYYDWMGHGTKGSFSDARDNSSYKYVIIGSQVWMAENLNYETEDSYCYKNSADSCAKYGRLYNGNEAKNACPEGWHLPSKAEFETLIAAVGGGYVAGKALKSTSGWAGVNGTDSYGFSALPAGGYYYGSFYDVGMDAYFWSATEKDSNNVYYMNLFRDVDDAGLPTYQSEGSARSVRCLKDLD